MNNINDSEDNVKIVPMLEVDLPEPLSDEDVEAWGYVVFNGQLFIDFHINSTGFRSGEYGGRNTSLIFNSLAFVFVLSAVCAFELSSISTIIFSLFFSTIFSRNSHTLSAFELSLKSIQLFPLIE